MRQIATLPDGAQARALADYLLTQHIETKLTPEAGGWELWVCDEDRLAQARTELEAFTRNPSDPRFAEASRAAEALRREESREEQAYRRKQVNLGERLRGPTAGARPLTMTLIALSVIISVASTTFFDRVDPDRYDPNNWLRQLMNLTNRSLRLDEVREGQVWRLVTPIFLHFGPWHLLFNLLMMRDFGTAVEARRGPVRYLLLVLVTAVCSNLAQCYFGFGWDSASNGFRVWRNPFFGGMSGVLYGLFGYVWMKSRFEPGLGLQLTPNTVAFLVGWLVLCMSPISPVPNVANTAHLVGLVTGMAVGYAPVLWRSFRRD